MRTKNIKINNNLILFTPTALSVLMYLKVKKCEISTGWQVESSATKSEVISIKIAFAFFK